MGRLRFAALSLVVVCLGSCSGTSPGSGFGGGAGHGAGGAGALGGAPGAGGRGAGGGATGTGGGPGAGGSTSPTGDAAVAQDAQDAQDVQDTGAAEDAGPACPTGRVLCGAECVDLTADPRHCNGCDSPCGANQVCASSQCQTPPDCRQTPCAGLSYCDLATGQCRPGCAFDMQCGSNEACDIAGHACVCKTSFHRCSGACVSDGALASCGSRCAPCPTDPNGTASCDGTSCKLACGSGYLLCGGACAACPGAGATAFACSGSACVATTCSASYHVCAGQCVSDRSTSSCGMSCAACPGSANGAATCDGRSCGLACNTGFRACGSDCAACPTSNVAATACSGAACVVSGCAAGYHICGDACVPATSTTACGPACQVCPVPANGSATCDGTSCGIACSSDYLACAGACALCPPDSLTRACNGAACIAGSCDATRHICNDQCVLKTSTSACGLSCSPCPSPPANASATCDGTTCGFACGAGYVRCSGACCADCRLTSGTCTGATWCQANGLCAAVQKLQPDAANATFNDAFGAAVGLAGTTAIVGSPFDDSNVGSAYVFQRGADGVWAISGTKLKPSAGGAVYFGAAVAIAGDRVVVSATGESQRGAVYLFDRMNGLFAAPATTKWLAEATGDSFGASVAVDGDRVLVGAPSADPAGVNAAGAAYVFERYADGSWPTAGIKLVASNPQATDQLGVSVSLSGDRAAVGTTFDDQVATNAGAVYIFARQTNGTWTQEQKVVAPAGHANDNFGLVVSLVGDRLVVGANLDDERGTNAGAAYVFERQPGGTWTSTAKLLAPPPNAGPNDEFGDAVALAGDQILVGARRENRSSASSGGVNNAGAAYLYTRQASGAWNAGVPVDSAPADIVPGRLYGAPVALSPPYALVGAPNDVTGPPAPGIGSGTAYVFDLSP